MIFFFQIFSNASIEVRSSIFWFRFVDFHVTFSALQFLSLTHILSQLSFYLNCLTPHAHSKVHCLFAHIRPHFAYFSWQLHYDSVLTLKAKLRSTLNPVFLFSVHTQLFLHVNFYFPSPRWSTFASHLVPCGV